MSAAKDYQDPPPTPLIDVEEFTQWSFYRAIIAEFVATLLFLYILVLTVIGSSKLLDTESPCGGVGVLGIAWAVGGMIFVLVYCTAGISGEFIALFFSVSLCFLKKDYPVCVELCRRAY